jgi:hypothetical protein
MAEKKRSLEQVRKAGPEAFVMDAIVRLRTGNYTGIHTVYSGFNAAFREVFPDVDPVQFTRELSEAGKLVIKPIRGGALITRRQDWKGELPVSTVERQKRALSALNIG